MGIVQQAFNKTMRRLKVRQDSNEWWLYWQIWKAAINWQKKR